MTTMEDLLRQVERDHGDLTPLAKASVLAGQVRPADLREAVMTLAHLVFSDRVVRVVTTPAKPPPPAPGSGLQPFQRPTRSTTKGLPRHGSPKVFAARTRWRDLLTTEVALPGEPAPMQLQDMTADMLTRVADALYDAHEQVHRLAETVTKAGVRTARELDDAVDAAAYVLESA